MPEGREPRRWSRGLRFHVRWWELAPEVVLAVGGDVFAGVADPLLVMAHHEHRSVLSEHRRVLVRNPCPNHFSGVGPAVGAGPVGDPQDVVGAQGLRCRLLPANERPKAAQHGQTIPTTPRARLTKWSDSEVTGCIRRVTVVPGKARRRSSSPALLRGGATKRGATVVGECSAASSSATPRRTRLSPRWRAATFPPPPARRTCWADRRDPAGSSRARPQRTTACLNLLRRRSRLDRDHA